MKKNDEFVGIVSAIGSNGEGIVKCEDKVVFVPLALTGEKIKYKILKVTSKCAYGKVLEIFTPAEMRVRPKCTVFGKCGGCQLQHVKYINQLKIKEQSILNTFRKVAGLDVDVKPTVKGDNEFRYRNKLQLPVVQTDWGVQIGFYAENSHRVIPITDCVINPAWTENVIRAFDKYFNEFNIFGYSEERHDGDVREIAVKEIKGNLIITLVVLNRNIKGLEKLIEILKEEIKLNFTLYVNVNDRKTNVIYGDSFYLIHGASEYTSEMLGVKYKIGVQSFMQINNSVCSKLYASVRDLIDADENTVVIDAYSGAGLMTAILAKKAKKAIGIEIVKEAVNCANELKHINKLDDKITNYLGKCEDVLPKVVESERRENSKIHVVLDPPRKGCDYKVIKSIVDNKVEKIDYVSCMPSTLARDVGLITGSLIYDGNEIKKTENPTLRYNIEIVKPFDMFAQTKHVETLVVLQRK